jgi:hypothetical protein
MGGRLVIRTFELIRDVDLNGISGTGTVAEGCQFSDGVCTMHWVTKHSSTTVYPDVHTLYQIHGHEGASRIVWHHEL